jgi:two-component system, NarL family, sensor histidine kinase UhpB
VEQAAAAGIKLALSVPELPLPLSASAQEALYSVAQAGVDNIVRHARALNMSVCVTADANEVALRITDDGVGISEADLAKDSAIGLFAASERLAEAGGDLRVSGKPRQGTTLEASIALRRQASRSLHHVAAPRQVA